MAKRNKSINGVWWGVAGYYFSDASREEYVTIAGRRRRDAKSLQEENERIVKIRIEEVRPARESGGAA